MSDLIDTTEMYLRTVYDLEEEGVPPLRARIAERLGQSGPTVSQTVQRMERDGGYKAFLLNYRIAPNCYPQSQMDLALAVMHVLMEPSHSKPTMKDSGILRLIRKNVLTADYVRRFVQF